MKATAIIADTTCDLSVELKEKYGIETFPLHIHLGDKEYADGIDISPDVHVKRIFYRTGLIDKKDKDNIDMIIYKAREIYPQFPGLIDFACWDIGRNWCTERKALCSECPLNEHCKKNI